MRRPAPRRTPARSSAEDPKRRLRRGQEPPRSRVLGRIPCVAVNWLILAPLLVLGILLVLLGSTVLLGRIAGGRYLRPIVRGLSKLPFLKRLFERMSNAALERENPELASALRKLQRFGTPTTPEAAQRALARLTPGERRAYLEAAGQQAGMPQAPNRASRRSATAVQRPAGAARRRKKQR
jgi:hypothetical protein